MIITRATDYAIRILIVLAGHQNSTRALRDKAGVAAKSTFARITREEIVKATHVPPAFLNKIVHRLVEANLVTARPGVLGGCSLTVGADEITELHVAEAMEGPVRLSECADDPSPCPRAEFCSFRQLLVELQDKNMRVLRSRNIAELAADGGQAITWLPDRGTASDKILKACETPGCGAAHIAQKSIKNG